MMLSVRVLCLCVWVGGCARTQHASLVCPVAIEVRKGNLIPPGLELLAGHPVEVGCPTQVLGRKTINVLHY